MSGIRRSLVLALGAFLVGLLAAGCGLSTNDAPEAITRTSVESSSSTTRPRVALPEGDAESVAIWFLHTSDAGTVLESVERQVAWPASPGGRLDALLGQPPVTREREAGLWSALPPDATLASQPRRQGEVLVVDLPEGVYDDLNGIIAQNAFAQIVWTATEIPGVDSVSFERDGAEFEAVDGQGQASADPLGRDDFVDLTPSAR